MTSKTFDAACDRLAVMFDAKGVEKRRFDREEGAYFKRVVSIVEELFAAREDYSVSSEGQLTSEKATVLLLSLHDKPFGQLTIKLDSDAIRIHPVELADSIAGVSSNFDYFSGIKFFDISEDSVGDRVAEAMNKFQHK